MQWISTALYSENVKIPIRINIEWITKLKVRRHTLILWTARICSNIYARVMSTSTLTIIQLFYKSEAQYAI